MRRNSCPVIVLASPVPPEVLPDYYLVAAAGAAEPGAPEPAVEGEPDFYLGRLAETLASPH